MPKSLRIFYVVSSLEDGGAEFSIPAIVSALERQGHQVLVLACSRRNGGAVPRLERAGIAFDVLSAPEEGRATSLLRLFRRTRRERPDILWTSMPRATLDGQIVGALLHIPVVSWQHSAYVRRYKAWAIPLLQRLSRFWIADSENVARFLQNVLRVDKPRIMRWALFIASPDLRQARPWTEGPFRIGSLGRLSAHKDYPTLLRGFAALRWSAPDVFTLSVLTIAGHGPEEDALRILARELDIEDRLELVGHLDDPSEFLASLHLYVQPSVMEGMCIAAHEAMTAGLPILATPVGELRSSVIPGETGYHIPHGAPDALAARLAELARDPLRAHEMGQKARALVLERFSSETFAASACEITERLSRGR